MTHLSPAEFVDAADGALPASRAAHLEQCGACRDRAAVVHQALDAARAADVPEPSPLFWGHLASRIHDRIAAETIVPAWRAHPWREVFAVRGLVPIASAVALVAAVFATGLMTRGLPPPASSSATGIVGTTPAGPGVEPEDSEVWQILTSAAADVPIEDAHAVGMAVPSGTVDRAVQRLSPEELSELGRLLQRELRGPGD